MDMQELYQAGQGICLSREARARILAECRAVETKKHPRWGWWVAAAGAVALVALVLVWFWPRTAPQAALDSVIPGEVDTFNDATTAATLPADELHLNGLMAVATDYAIVYDPEQFAYPVMTDEELEAYFGRELAIDPVPEGLTPDPGGPASMFIQSLESGEMVMDSLELTYWDGWNDDGSRVPVLEGGRGFSVTMYQQGNISCGAWLLDGEAVSLVAGQEVTIGYTTVGTVYGEDQVVEWPVYVADFTMDGIVYEVEAENLDLDTVVEILHALIEG